MIVKANNIINKFVRNNSVELIEQACIIHNKLEKITIQYIPYEMSLADLLKYIFKTCGRNDTTLKKPPIIPTMAPIK